MKKKQKEFELVGWVKTTPKKMDTSKWSSWDRSWDLAACIALTDGQLAVIREDDLYFDYRDFRHKTPLRFLDEYELMLKEGRSNLGPLTDRNISCGLRLEDINFLKRRLRPDEIRAIKKASIVL